MRGLRLSHLATVAFLLAIPGSGVTLPWDKDMQDQPSMKPQDSLVETNPTSVPVAGKDRYPPPKDIIELVGGYSLIRVRLDPGFPDLGLGL